MRDRQRLIDKAVGGREVVAYVTGTLKPNDPHTNLYRAIVAAGYQPDDIGDKIDVVVGARRSTRPDGWQMAIVKL